MEPDRTRETVPLVLLLELDAALMPVASSGSPLNEAVLGALVKGLSELMETLGIPGEPVVEIKFLPGPLDARFMRLTVGGQILHYPDEVLQSVYCWLTGTPVRVDITSTGMLAEMMVRVGTASAPDAPESEREKIASLLSQMSLAIIKLRPSVLLGKSQLAAYVASLPVPEMKDPARWPPDRDWLSPILRKALNLRISIADKSAVADTLAQCIESPSCDAGEMLIDVLRPDAVEIHVEEDYLRQLTTSRAESGTGPFSEMRDLMFAELGILYPVFRLVPDARLAPRQFMLKLNHLTCVPQVGLGPGECQVNETPENLKLLGITGTPAGNPASELPNSITNLEHKSVLEASGFTTWDQMGYLILSLAAMLRSNGACFVSRAFVEGQLEQLEKAFPALVVAARSVVSVEELTEVLRNLAAEQISLQNLRLILERLLDFQFRNDSGGPVLLDDAKPAWKVKKTVLEDHVAELTRFLRQGMKREISGKYSRRTDTIVVYLIDQAIEDLLSARTLGERAATFDSPSVEEQNVKILDAVRNEIRYLPPTAQIPCILTASDIRGKFRETIALEFPRIPVIGYDEIPPSLNIQPIARIFWNVPANA